MEEISIYCDGGARGNPGPAAIAFVVFQRGKIIYKFGKRIGETTNNVAEYKAVIEALSWLKENSKTFNFQFSIFNFYLDSQLVVNQLNGLFRVKDYKLRQLIINVKLSEQKLRTHIYYHSISREKNKIADSLVNQAFN